MAVGDNSRSTYRSIYRANIKPAYTDVSVRDAASGRARAEELLNITMASKAFGTRCVARQILTSALDHLAVHGIITAIASRASSSRSAPSAKTSTQAGMWS